MRVDLKNGRRQITLHETDRREFLRVRDKLRFIESNTPESSLNVAADTGSQAIQCVLERLGADTPEVDTPSEAVPLAKGAT